MVCPENVFLVFTTLNSTFLVREASLALAMLVLPVRFHVTVQEHTIGVRGFVRETVGLNGESSHVTHKRKCY